MLKTVTLARLK